MTLVEECAGTGQLIRNGAVLREVQYRVSRYQGMAASGLPLPGRFRIEGSIDFDPARDPADLIGASLTLRLDDGRALGVVLVGSDGRVLLEGHGPRAGCGCC